MIQFHFLRKQMNFYQYIAMRMLRQSYSYMLSRKVFENGRLHSSIHPNAYGNVRSYNRTLDAGFVCMVLFVMLIWKILFFKSGRTTQI